MPFLHPLSLATLRRRCPAIFLPLSVLALAGLPLFWAWPQGLPPWRSAAIIAAWLGCGLLLASLLLMVRTPRLAYWLGGLERMYLWHHRLGVLAYLALLLHPLALARDAWQESPALAWAALSPWQRSWPLLSGWAALLCLMVGLALALTPQLAYGRWRRCHGLLAAAIGFGCSHLLLVGLEPWLLWVPLSMLAILLGRVLLADYGLAARPYLVSAVRPLGASAIEVDLRPLAQGLQAEPGQFVQAAFFAGPRFQGCGEYHPFTLSAIAPDGQLSLGIKALGDCTRHLQGLEPGVAVRLQGPFGSFLGSGNQRPKLGLAGGIGITPFMAVLRGKPLPAPLHLIYFHRDQHDAAYGEELLALAARQPNLNLVQVVNGDTLPDLHPLLPDSVQLKGWECYLCGPPGLMAASRAILQERGVDPDHIHQEAFYFS